MIEAAQADKAFQTFLAKLFGTKSVVTFQGQKAYMYAWRKIGYIQYIEGDSTF